MTFWTRHHPRDRKSLSILAEKRKEKRGKNVTDVQTPGCLTKCLKADEIQHKVTVNVKGYSLVEDKKWKLATNIGGVFVLVTTAFLYGYFA